MMRLITPFISFALLGFVSCIQSDADDRLTNAMNELHKGLFDSDSLDQDLRITYVDSVLGQAQRNHYVSGQIHAFLELGNIYRNVTYDSSIYFFKEGIKLSNQAGDSTARSLLAKTYNDLGITFQKKGLVDSAISVHLASIDLYKEMDHLQGLAWNYNNLGVLYGDKGAFDSSVYYHQRSIQMAKTIGDSLGIGYNLLSIGNGYFNIDNRVQAIDHFFEATQILEKLDIKPPLIYAYNNIANAYLKFDPEKGFAYALKSDSISTQIDNPYLKARSSSTLANVLYHTGDHQSAILKYKEAILYSKSIGHLNTLGTSYIDMAACYKIMENLDSALWSLQQMERLIDETGVVRSSEVADTYEDLSVVYYEKQQYELAKKYANQAVQINENLSKSRSRHEVYRILGLIHKLEGDLERSVQYLEKANELEVSFLIANQDRLMARKEAEHNFSKEKEALVYAQEKKEQQLNGELRVQRLTKILVLVGLIIMIIVCLVIYSHYQHKKQMTLELEQLNERLVMLSHFKESLTGMIAHDLKNPLGVLLETESTSVTGKQMARQMLGLVENMLDVHRFEQTKMVLDQKTIALDVLMSEVIDQVAMLLEGKNVHLDYQVASQLMVSGDTEVIQRVIINLLTNAIKYTPQNSSISLIANMEGGQVRLAVQDQGNGLSAEEMKEVFKPFHQLNPRKSGITASTGLGLTFCQMALEAHGTKMEVSSTKGKGATFSFLLPVSSETEMEQSAEIEPANKTRMTSLEKATVFAYLPRLRDLRIYDAYEIEKVLEEIKSDKSSPGITSWIASVLNAAYSNNESYYQDLLRVE